MWITLFMRSLISRSPLLHKTAVQIEGKLRSKWYRSVGLSYIDKEIIAGPNKGLIFSASKKVSYSKDFWSGEFELESCQFMQNTIKPMYVCYDVGANLGYHSLLLSRKAPQGFIFAFEPLPEACSVFRHNMEINQIRNVKLVEKAVAATSGPLTLGRDVSVDQASIRWTEGRSAMHESFTCESISLDDFVEAGNPTPNFIKIDVEGAEGEVLAGATKILMNSQIMILCEIHGLEAATKVYDILKKSNYQLFRTGKSLTTIDSINCMPTRMHEGHVFAYPL